MPELHGFDEERGDPASAEAGWSAAERAVRRLTTFGARLAVLCVCSCSDRPAAALPGRLALTLLHTADLHSRLFPFPWEVGPMDARLGLGDLGTTVEVGGFERIATLVAAERRANPRTLLLDSGDAVSGSLAFGLFGGEPEQLALSGIGVSAQALGNHEFDHGQGALVALRRTAATFPLLAANFMAEGPGSEAPWFQAFTVLGAEGLRVGVIGAANRSSLRALSVRPNPLGVVPLEASRAVQQSIEWLRPLVDLVVLVSHLGLEADRELIARTSGLDVVLGGHNHLVFERAERRFDCDSEARVRRDCAPRPVLLVHSGAYGRFLGRLELALSDLPEDQGSGSVEEDGFEVIGQKLSALPVSSDVSKHAALAELLEPYRRRLEPFQGIAGLLGYVPVALSDSAEAEGAGLVSPLANLTLRALHAGSGWSARLSVINAGAIRSALPAGALTLDGLARVLPFDDRTLLYRVTGRELAELLGEVQRKMAERRCQPDVRIDGARLKLTCSTSGASDLAPVVYVPSEQGTCQSDSECAPGVCRAQGGLERCFREVEPDETLEVATTEYFATSHSVLARRRPLERGPLLRALVAEWIQNGEPCRAPPACEDDVGDWLRTQCSASACGDSDLAALGVAYCRTLACVDAELGAVAEERIEIVP